MTERLDKIARMVHAGVPNKQTALAVGVSEGRISQILDTPEFVTALGVIEASDFERMDLLNQGWDGVEEKALEHVVNYLHSPTVDEDFALKAAIMASRAPRRGKSQNSPIAIQPNIQTVIELSAQFVNKLQQNFTVAPCELGELPKKDTNMLNIKGVRKILGAGDRLKATRISHDVAALDLADAAT